MPTKTEDTKELENTKELEKMGGGTAVTTYDYGADADAGFENQTSDDYAMPFIGIVQSNSKIVDANEKAKAGMIANNVTGDVVDGKEVGIGFVPCATHHCFVEWIPRENGGGIAGRYPIDSEVVAKAKEESTEFGKYKVGDNDLVETFYVYGIAILPDGSAEQAVIGFKSTHIKKYKAWMTKARGIMIDVGDGRKVKAPLFSHVYRLKTVKESRPGGDSWNWDVKFDGENATVCRLAPTDELYLSAKGLHDAVFSGAASVRGEEGDDSGGDGDDIPF